MSTSESRIPIVHGEISLLEAYHRDGDLRARAVLIENMMPLVRHIARRYANRGEPLDDLVQVGSVGLIKAVDRFDLERGVKLSTFAAPNIAGEIKRHFRDRGWSIRVPRDIQELNAKLTQATDRLTTKLSRSPTIAELAVAVKATEEQVLDALQGAQSYSTVSFEEPIGENRTALELLGEEDPEFMTAERRVLLEDGMHALADREQEIVRLRFFAGLTQREIAEQVGISQMHVSRLIRRSLEEMRDRMDERDAAPAPTRRLRAA
ncbi:MAG: SigB/SigF/SigG family RNA polymerase sigma factor [Solirubrobacterales bacterium]|nr:SigB/SigF/SigG family RNA polymerase sigma factor [Solirubrobacterales bacterium]